jgi:hypothetical protein
MRRSGETQSSECAGEVLNLQACIQVGWAWLSLPIAILSLTIAFLVATILSCVDKGIWISCWGSSALAVFFSGFDSDTRSKVCEASLKNKIDDVVEGVYV